MPVTFHIPGPLRDFTGGSGGVRLETSHPTVGEALAALWRLHPGLRDRVMTEEGRVRPHVNLFVGGESIRYTGGWRHRCLSRPRSRSFPRSAVAEPR
jgi:sulfur-carrier protein adenylyltransferase/sulfurtransferase